MQTNALRLVAAAIEQRIRSGSPGTSVHVGPLDDILAASSHLVLFLYRVSVNADLRNAERRAPAPNPANPVFVYDDAIPFDLHFLLSASPSKDSTDLEGLEKLGEAIRALNAPPELVGIDVAGDTVRLSLETVSTEEMGRIWSLFPTVNYRTSVAYLATPVWLDPAAPRRGAAPVTDERYRAPLVA